jgi:hypothetical protein
MYLLYCDETNLEPRRGDFFVYGGISIPDDAALPLSIEIDRIRNELNVPTNYILKFNPGPADFSHAQFITLKQRVIEAAINHGVKLFTSLILHDIATSPAQARINEINRVCLNFNTYLTRMGSHGLDTPERRLAQIVGFHYAAIGQSHYTSIVDIVLGSFRFCINGHTRNDAAVIASAQRMLPILSPLFYRVEGMQRVSELGIFFSPVNITTARYNDIYEELKNYLHNNGIMMREPARSAV